MNEFQLFAQPWWINLFIIIPFAVYYFWRKDGLVISKFVLIVCALFGIAFGFVEASVVIYLRAAVGLLPGYGGTLSDVARLSADMYQQAGILSQLPKSLLAVEFFREAATMIILLSIALVAVKSLRERLAIFLWTFAVWDISYYIGLWATVRWPSSPLTPDVLFLIPVPWFSQVWFPLLISTLIVVAVVTIRKDIKNSF
ncbi:hypothetical protein A3D66_01690 [Candidatus Kaiserbacteria bacterium RIFCSPHIGHO2_02_FULL_50_9]|uniref:Uncharacterized protein n=1 Tax=Candidatus Kaiserbacteria bacterium RIFCSPLOWO2_01_FULL_51_21 TaxID=1798508 RepID=A0A1F6EDM3_9BACT|nr:MAG: hypothetical protein A3D66_01690 [Candidatus Kaiserbacteria bacterium RIFCSPHIGHO2_02_FULL_50_9]OGG71758.1 MAG: hypothetical protein A3A35_02045 [Candidatus Kaiserbacteria bacterium RIFCSPLOWO2_01_FULL_51_21]